MSDRNSTMSQPVDLQSPDDIALADRMNAGRQQIVSELKKLIIGQDEVIGQVLMTLFVGGNSLIVGAPGLAKTLLIYTISQGARPQVLAHPVHARPDAVRHHRHRPGAGRRHHRPAPDGVRARPDLRQHRAGRRDQPHAAQDAVGAARGDAGAPRHDPGPHLPARRAFLRVRDAEPDRARRHLSAARGAARPLHVPHHHRAPAVRRGDRGGADDDRDPRARVQPAGFGRRPGGLPAPGPQGAGGRTGDAARARHRAGQPARRTAMPPSW